MQNNDKTQKNLSGLHNTLETMGYSVPNIDQFAKDMRKEENLRSVYDKVSSGGYELPDFETFKANMGWIKPTPAGVPTPLRPKDQLAPTGKPDAPATPFGFDLPANPKKPSHAPKARLGFPRLDKKMHPVQEVNDPSVPLLKTTRDVAQDENGNVVNVVQPELVPDFDPNNGGVTAPKALLDVTTGKTIRPTELSKKEVDGYNAGNIDAVKDPKLRQALKEANIIYAPTLTESDARRKAGELTSEIDKALAERTEYLDKKAGDVTIADSPTAWGIRGFNIPAAANKSRIEQANDSEYMMLEAARSTMHDVNNLIAEADHNTKEGGDLASVYERSALAGTLRGFGSTIIDPRVWDQGARDLSASSRLALALDKADRGEKLTRGEQLLLDAKANEMATALYFEDRIGRGYKAGSVTAHAIPFMVEMAMSGGISTMGKNVSSGLARYAMRRFGAKEAGKAIIKRTIRGAATTAGAMLAGGAMANTFGAMKTAANVVGRTTGDVQFATGVDAEGRATTTYGGHTEGDSLGEAFVKGELSNTAEYATELLGDGLVDVVKWAAGKVASPVASKLAQLIGKTGVGAAEQVGKKSVLGKVVRSIGDAGVWTLSKASKFIENLQASKFATSLKALEKQAQWNGVFGEYLEELANNAAAVMIGDKDLSADKGKGFFNLDDNIDTFLGVSLMGGVMSGAQTAGYFAGGGARGMARYQIGQSEGAVWSTLTTDEQRKAWDVVRRQILLRDGKEQVDAVRSALTNPNFNAEQRRAILDYTKSVQTYKGMSEYRRKQSEDTKADPLQNELTDSYDKGAGMTEAEEMSHARSWYEFAQKKAAERLGVDANALDEMGAPDQLTLDQVAQLREEHNEQAVQSYVDYLNARATYEGMIGSVSQGIQAEAAQAEQAVRSQQHKDGTLRRATLRGTEGQNVEVHIKDGDLVMDEEGRIDTDKSSKDFIVRDNETGVVRFASIDDIISAEQPTSADDAVSEAVNAVYERREKEAADAINGTITPQAGAVYNLLDADGNPQQIAIRQVGQDGTLDVDYSGVPHKMTTDELQSMADNTRARQIENEHAAQVQQAKAEEREEREQAGLPRYALNDELTIRTPEGEEVTAYVTNEEDADGNIEVYFNEPFDGQKVHLFTKDYLDGVVVGTRLSPETNTSAGTVEAPATVAAPALAQAQPVSEEVPEEATTASTPTQEEENDIIGRSMTEEEAEAFLTAISNNHEVAPELELTPENWYAEFGEDGMVHTPIGDAHMGENQFLKMMRDGRKSKLGMIRPTLEAPHAIVEEPSMAKEGQETERDSSYIYIRVFEKEDGSRHYHFTSVSVQRDGGEVIVSNQEKSRNQVKRLLTEGVVLWMRADNAPDTSDVDQDLYSSQGTELSDPASEGTDASQSTPSESKDNESTSHADPNDESLSPEEAYEAVLRATNGDVVLALEVIESTIADKEKALAKAKKAKPRSADSIEGKIQAREEVAAGIEAAETSLAHWQAVAEIAAEQVQEEVAEVAEPVAEQTEQESEEPTAEQEPEAEQEEEAIPTSEDTAPEWGKDNPADARARGYIKVEGLRVDRQGQLSDALIGKESDVKFATNDTQQARYAIIEAESLQPSHIRGYQNQLHFIPEAQPKDRSDVVSEQAAVRIAANINPEEITTSATAYTGAPTINARGEVIQGNSRADALRAVWESFRDTSGAKYKQYLIENAETLGIDPEAIEGMKSPVLVHLADVSDERAIELGQYRQADIESGGVERINPQTLYAKIGEKRDTFIRFLLGTSDDDLSLAESITRNAAETLSWLNRQGFISDTQFRSAFGAKGEITAEAKEDLRNALYRSFFEGAHNSLVAEFYNLPKRAQQALLRVSYRDQQSPADAHFLDELQSSVSAYNALMGYTPFAEAKTFEDAERAIETWMRFSGDLITGEVNSEQYSNFAVQLALRYKFLTQKELISKLNAVYDAVQAVSEDTLFGEGEVNPKTLAEAVGEVFSINIDNNTEEDGSTGSSSPGSDLEGSNGGEQEGQGTPGSNEQDQSRAGTPERRGRAASDPQEGEGVTTETEEVAPEAGDTQASDATGEGYRLSAIAAKRGGNFFENSEGSIDLVKISDNVFEAIGIKPLPMRMTEAMAQHIIKQHAKELGISTQEEAVAFVVDIMQNFDHVREGDKPNTYIFSIEKGRSRTGKRAVTLVLPSKSGEYLGVSSSGYEKVSRLKERALLWEEGANNMAPTTETASANVPTPSATQGGMTGGSASNQSNALSQGKDSEKDTAEGEANDGNQDDLSIEEKEALLSKAKLELEEKEAERTAVAEQAIALMKDYYDSGAISGMDSGEFHGQATLILIGFKDRSNLELMKAPGLSELLPSLYKLADEARAKKVLVRKYEKELSQAKEVEGETLTHDKDIRDELVNTMRDAGIEVVTDEAEGQAVLDAARAGEAQMQRAYHGTDADFEAFDHSHMGEGAGGQAYGWGSYFTEEEGVARSYAGGGFVYEAELPDDTGSNYLHFESKPSNKDIARVKRELVEYILRNDEEGMYDYPQGKDDLTQEVDDAGEPTIWRDLYGTVSSHLGSDKEASAFFHSIGYVGIRYNSSESEGGKTNFVIFDESDISIQSKARLFKTSSGEVYGFVKDGKIYLDLKHATAETAIHEYTHLWASALRRVNPRAWKSIREQLKGFELWADIASRYPELKGDEDALADEVLAQYSGKRGAQRIEEEMKKAENATDLVGKARVLAAFNSLKEALKTFWTEVADFFGMDYYKSVEDAADKAMSDLLRGVNPNAVEAKKETTKKKPTKKATAKKETATSSVIAPDSERYNGYIVTLPKSGKAGAEVGNIEEFVGADEMREGLTVVYQAPEGFAVASNGTMAIADKTQFDVYKKGKAYKLDGSKIDAGAWKPLKDKWQSFISTETRGEHSDPFTESPVNITRLSKYLDRVEQDLYNRWKTDKSEGITRDSFKAYRGRALVSIPNGRDGYVSYPYTDLRTIALAAKRLGVTSFFVEGDLHFGSSEQPGRRLVGNGRLGSVVHAGYFETRDPNVSKRKELSYLYDESVGVKDIDEGVRMQKELEEKEAKYAEMDAQVSAANNVSNAEEDTEEANDEEVRYRSDEEVNQDDLDMQDLKEVATSMAEALGEDVRVIHDTAEIEGRNESETRRMRGAKGWYDPKTGQVVVVLPNAESADDVEATILHEVVGHKGLQELVGKDQFGKFLDEVFEGANEAVRNGIVERSKRYGWNTRLATEEYIAELAEQGFKDLEARDLWNVVRNAFYNLLSRVKLALGWNISDRELRYMLWRTYQMKKGEGLMGQAKDIAMQEKLGVGNYEEARFRQGESAAPVKVAATYDALIKKSSYQMQEALQDSMLSLKKVMEMIMQAKGDAKYIEEIEGYQNAYMGENRVSSVNQAEAAAYSRMALEPLVEEVSRLAKKAHHSYVTDYMMAKHGLERNRVMAFQKAVEADVDAHNKAVKESGEGEELSASSLWDAYLNDTDRIGNEADYRNGLITADVWHKTDDEIRARYAPSYAEYRERDYAGLTGLLDRPDVDIQTLEEEAIEEVMKFEQENDVTDLWDLTNKATDAPLSKQYEGGLMSRETLEHVRNMYGYYIPLRGFDETTSDDAYSYLGDRDRAFSPTLKKAKGRSSKAEGPLAHIASMMESAILQSNRNKLVRQKFLNFVENNPSDLFSVQKLWVKWNEVTKAWEAVLPEFDPNDTSEEVIRKTQEFEEMMQENKRKDPKNFKLASEQPSIPYRVVSLGEQMQHQIIVKRGGRDVVIIVNGDPRVAMAVNGQTNPDGEAKGHIGALFRTGAAVNRKLAGFYTSLSPNFVVKNFIRDVIYANTIAWVKESPTYAMTYHANVAKLTGQMHRLVHLYEHDKLDMSNETHRAFKLFMENGGETGYSQLRSMDRHKKEVERMMKESGGRISPKQAFRLLGDTMEFANRGIEDLSRFAAFLTSRQMGRTIDRSIYDAKEMTVNFNKKGAGSTFYDATTQSRVGNAAALLSGTGRSLYLFWNVSIQGSVNIARAVKRNPKKGKAYLATFLALGILQTMLPALTGGDDDDRYWNLPDYVRRNNICFFVGDVLVKIPLPQEARAIFGIGELGMSYSSGKENKTPMELAQTIAGQISQVMPLDLMDDSGATHALMPSLAKPFFEAQTNHSWMGRPIWKDTDYNKAMPDWTKAYKATGGGYVWLAKELNALTGGDDYKQGWVNINPAKLEYMLKGYLGGLYTAADQIIKSSETAFGDREFSMRDVPLLSGFLDGVDERNDMRNVNNTYYHFKEEAKEVLRLGKSYESDLEQGKSDSTDYAKKLDELVNTKSYERALLFEDLSKEIEAMQKALKEATDPKEAEELQAEIDKQKKALVIQLRQMK